MRTIQISTSVFAAIWAAREDGEDTEDQVLQRVLGAQPPPAKASSVDVSGYTSKRYNFSVPEGFRIERTFKGRDYEAQATGGGWKLEGADEIVTSPTALSKAIETGIENVWANWFYKDQHGKRRPISDLRDPQTIKQRGE